MQESSLTISPVTKQIATGGAIGMCAGLIAAPGKYSLKRLLVQPPDIFEKIFSPSVTKKMNSVELNSLEEIKKASAEFFASGNIEQKNVKPAAVAWAEKFKGVPIDSALEQNIKNKKNYLKKLATENNYVSIRNDYNQARELLLEDLDNKFAHEYYKNMKQKFKQVKKTLKKPIEDYKNLIRDAYNQRVKNLKKLPNRGIEVKLAYEKLQKAMAAKRTITANKLFELTNQANLKKHYKTVSKFLPKARTRSAINGALILSTLTAMGVIFFNPSPQNNK